MVTSHIALDGLGWIAFCPVDNRIRQRLRQGQFDRIFFAFNTFLVSNDAHHALDDGIDRISVGSQRNTEFEG